MDEAPTGTVALAFSDVQGSTALWEAGPAQMREALAVHDAVLRRTIAEVGGYEVKTEGDAFMVAFRRVADGVRWCLLAQLALLDAAWPETVFERPEAAIARAADRVLFRGLRVRMGVHVGEPDCRPDPVTARMDYFGPVVNRAARVSAAGHGGQVLLSRAALTGAGAGAIVDAEVIDLGEHRLKGLITTEHLYQLLPHRLVGRTFPPVRTLAAPRTNLSPSASTLCGRAAERAQLDETFERGARVVALVGPSGAGKTRFAREYALAHLDEYGGGAWFCDLSQAETPEHVQSRVAGVLGVTLPAGASTDDATIVLGRALAARDRILFVLDNVERVVEAAGATIGEWVLAAPRAAFLVTSRVPLVDGHETVVELGPLDDDAALSLLVDRARKAGADVDATRDAAPLRELAAELERLPLALELAAPRLRVIAPAPLAARLAQGIELARRARVDGAPPPPLRAAIAATWDLLDCAERAAIAQATAFRGSFTIEAAEAVLALDDDAPPVLDVVQALRDKSLLATHRTPGAPPRFSIYASVRSFVENVADPEERAGAGDRHAKHYVALGERLVRESEGPRAMLAYAELGRELDNLRAVLFGQHDAHPGLAARSSLLIDHTLSVRGPGALRQEVLDAGLDASRACSHGTARARIHLARAKLALARGDLDAAAAELDQGEPMATGSSEAVLPRIWIARAHVLRRRGQAELAIGLYGRAFEAARDDATRALVLEGRAALADDRGDPAAAATEERAAIDAAVRAGDRRLEARLRQRLGGFLHVAGELDGADESYRAALEVVRSLGDARLEGVVLADLGLLLCDRAALVEARAMLDGALPLLETSGDVPMAGVALQRRGLVELRAGRAATGQAALDQALEHHRAAGARRLEGIDHGYLGIASLLGGDVRSARACLARADAALAEAAADPARVAPLVDPADPAARDLAPLRAMFAAFAAAAAARAGEAAAAHAAWARATIPDAPAWLTAVRDRLAPVVGGAGAAASPDAVESTHAALATAVARGP